MEAARRDLDERTRRRLVHRARGLLVTRRGAVAELTGSVIAPAVRIPVRLQGAGMERACAVGARADRGEGQGSLHRIGRGLPAGPGIPQLAVAVPTPAVGAAGTA